MKKFTTFALTAAVASALSFSAFAGQVEQISSTWKVGYSLDDSGAKRYHKSTHVKADTSYNSTVSTHTYEISSSNALGGFQLDDTQGYVKTVTVKNPNVKAQSVVEETRSTWALGFYQSDNGSYIRF